MLDDRIERDRRQFHGQFGRIASLIFHYCVRFHIQQSAVAKTFLFWRK